MFDLQTIKLLKTQEIGHPGGSINKILNCNDDKFKGFGEIYISSIKFNYIKAWKYHKKISLNLFVLTGDVKFVFFNGNEFKSIEISSKDMNKIFVPPKVWYGFKGENKQTSRILSLTNFIFDEKELERKDINEISYDW